MTKQKVNSKKIPHTASKIRKSKPRLGFFSEGGWVSANQEKVRQVFLSALPALADLTTYKWWKWMTTYSEQWVSEWMNEWVSRWINAWTDVCMWNAMLKAAYSRLCNQCETSKGHRKDPGRGKPTAKETEKQRQLVRFSSRSKSK